MNTISSEVAEILRAIGISEPIKWKRGPDIAAPPNYHIAYVCQCRFQQVFLTPITLHGREIMIGQCQSCKLVHWGNWVSKEEEVRVSRARFQGKENVRE